MSDLQRIEAEYNRRSGNAGYQSLYSVFNAGNLHAVHSRERALMSLLRRNGLTNLSDVSLLDIGCGSGGELLRWIGYGVKPENCAGVDLMPDRVAAAQSRLPGSVRLQQADASRLDHPDACYDIVTQFTVFSSILDDGLKRAIALEMRRVLKSTGCIIWYDFWFNPKNKQTRGIRMAEIRSLFPGCKLQGKRVTLAPPIARRIAPLSSTLADMLEWLPLKTHWLVHIQPCEGGQAQGM
jgi:ubiquinone/menaquinone biosynthesis C-methylase UbiE